MTAKSPCRNLGYPGFEVGTASVWLRPLVVPLEVTVEPSWTLGLLEPESLLEQGLVVVPEL